MDKNMHEKIATIKKLRQDLDKARGKIKMLKDELEDAKWIIVRFEPGMNDFWIKTLPGNLSKEYVVDYIRKAAIIPPFKIFYGKEVSYAR